MTKKNTIIKGVTVGCLLFSGCLLSYLKKPNYIGFYLNDSKIDTLSSYDNTVFHKAICDNEATVSWNNDSKELSITNLKEKTRCNLYFVKATYDFDYTGAEQNFTAPVSGTYKLETWGAQGGSYTDNFGKGGYSVGYIKLIKKSNLYILVGGAGRTSSTENIDGGYNGGGLSGGYQDRFENKRYFSSGGGATSIQNKLIADGLLENYINDKQNVIIVAGGGGGSFYDMTTQTDNTGGSGGGKTGGNGEQTAVGWGSFGYGGTQESGGKAICDENTCREYQAGIGKEQNCYGSFGKGGNGAGYNNGGGGGFFGGGASIHVQSAGGGSGYIGNSLLTDKAMYCYNCEESSEESTRTISTTCSEESPTSNCSKKGNGYVRITLISIDE